MTTRWTMPADSQLVAPEGRQLIAHCRDCPKTNPDCMWYFRHGMIVSARNSALAIRGVFPSGGPSPNLIPDDRQCQWVWQKGLLQNVGTVRHAAGQRCLRRVCCERP